MQSKVLQGDLARGYIAMRTEQLLAFNAELAGLARVGLPLEPALRAVAGLAPGGLEARVNQVAGGLERGESLPAALRNAGFPETYAALVSAGLKTGRLAEALEEASRGMSELAQLKRALRLASIYPLMVLVFAYGLFVAVVLFYIPQVVETLEFFRLPVGSFVTVLDSLGRTAVYWGPGLPAVFVLSLASGPVWRLATGRGGTGIWLGTGAWWRDARHAQFSHLLGLLVEHRTTLPDALRLAAGSTGSGELMAESAAVATAIEGGFSLAQAVDGRRRFPGLLAGMMLSQEPAALSRAAMRISEIYRQRARVRAQMLRTMVPILLLAGLGAVAVGSYALSVVLPVRMLLDQLASPFETSGFGLGLGKGGHC